MAPVHEFVITNAILRALPQADLCALAPSLRPISFDPQSVLLRQGETSACVFIEEGIVSLLLNQNGAAAVEVGMVGRNGMLGLPAVLGGEPNIHSAVAITSGRGWTVDVALLGAAVDRSSQLRQAILHHANERLRQAMRHAACHLQHGLEQRVAAWIEVATRLLGSNSIAVTHKRISQLVGATRSSVTLILQDLEGKKAIRSRRNKILVSDLSRLQMIACQCYRGAAEAQLPQAPLSDHVKREGPDLRAL